MVESWDKIIQNLIPVTHFLSVLSIKTLVENKSIFVLTSEKLTKYMNKLMK